MAKKPTYISVSDEDFEKIVNNFKTGKIDNQYKDRFIGTPPAAVVSITIENLIPRYLTFFGVLNVKEISKEKYNEAIKQDFFSKMKEQGFRFRVQGFFPNSSAGANFGGKYASIEKIYGPEKNSNKLLYQIFVSSPTLLAKNQLVAEKKKTSEPQAKTKPTQTNLAPGDIAIENGDERIAIYDISNLESYSYISSFMLRKVKQRLEQYSIVLDKQIDFIYQSSKINALGKAVKSAQVSADATRATKIKFIFNKEDYSLREILFFINKEDKSPVAAKGKLKDSVKNYFDDKTTNSIIFNLSKIYNKYSNRITVVSNNLFENESDLKTFMQKYVYPKSTFRDSGVGVVNDLIESFILGDVRLLDEDVFRQYVETNAAFTTDAFRGQMEAQVSQQYEGINDVIGEAFFKGKFKEIETVEQFFEDLLDYVPIPELIALSAKCLMKIIPLREWIDTICKDYILKGFDKHKEAIIQELESMESGVAKDLATRLKDIYFNRVVNEQVLIDTASQAVGALTELTSNAFVLDAWKAGRVTDLKLLFERISLRYRNTAKALGPDTTAAPDGTDYISDRVRKNLESDNLTEILWSDSLIKRKEQKLLRRQELEDSKTSLNEKKAVFGGNNEPPSATQTSNYYTKKIAEIDTEIVEIDNAITNARELLIIFRTLCDDIFPALLEINPYLNQEEKNEIKAAYKNDTYINLDNPEVTDNPVDFLKGIGFNFPSDYSGAGPVKKVEDGYDQAIVRLVELYDQIRELESSENNSLKVLNKLQDQANQGLELAVNEIFGDETQRYYLCFAIIGSIGAAAYMIVKLFMNLDETVEDIKKATGSVVDAVEKRIVLLMRYDYPYVDILEEFSQQLKQIAINLTRDLIITGLMAGMEELRKLCSEEEAINAPYNPVGAIDLSGFLTNSRRGPNGQKTGTVEASPSFAKVSSIDPGITPQIYQSILLNLSFNFSINELFSLFGDTASDELYTKVLESLLTLTPSPISENSNFYKYYLNESGVRQFIEALSKDIEFSFFARAKDEFEKQKKLLLEACVTDDYSFVVENLDIPDGQSLNDYLEAAAAKNRNAIEITRRIVDSMMQPNVAPELCADGKGILTDPQKFTARQIGQSIFSTIDNQGSFAVTSAKTIYSDPGSGYEKYRETTIVPLGQKPKSPIEIVEENYTSLQDYVDGNSLAGRKIYQSFFNNDPSITNPLSIEKFRFTREKTNDVNKINFLFEEEEVTNEKIDFEFDVNKDQLNLDYSFTVSGSGEEEVNKKIVSYSENKYFDSIRKEFNIETPEGDLSPLNNLFGFSYGHQGGAIINQPDYSQGIQTILSNIMLEYEDANGDDPLILVLNSIFRDLFLFSFKTGLYQRKNFNKFDLRKKVVNSFDEGTGIDNCFLGFYHPDALTEETVKLAERIVCYYSNSATQTPVNIAFVKTTFDCFIRTIVLQEFMQSFFNFGIFPQDLIFSEVSPVKTSFYEKLIRIKIEDALKNSLNAQSMDYPAFYDQVFKKFVVDLTRIIFQNQNLSEENSLTFIINSQIQFVKTMLKKAYINAFGSSESVIGQTEFQLLEQKIFDDVSNSADTDNSEKNLALLNTAQENFDIVEKIRSIQNDGLAAYYDATNPIPSKVLFGGDSYLFTESTATQDENGAQTIEEQTFQVGLNTDERLPVHLRDCSSPGVVYQDLQKLMTLISKDPNKITYNNVKGLSLEKFIELKPNLDFVNNSGFAPEIISQFLVLLEKHLNASYVQEVSEYNAQTKEFEYYDKTVFVNPSTQKDYRNKLRMFIYETKLFVLFPQVLSFIDSFKEDSGTPLWEIYEEKTGKPFDLLSKTYKMNFDPSFFNEEDNVDWLTTILEDQQLREAFDFSLFGKIRLSDFRKIVDKFLYPSFSDDAFLKENDEIQNEAISETTSELLAKQNGAALTDYFNKLFDLQYPTRAAALNSFTSNKGYESLDSFMKKWVVDAIYDEKSLLHWFYTQKLSDVLEVNSTIRLEMKLPETENFDLSKKLSEKLFSSEGMDASSIRNQQMLLKEKIGPEIIGNKSNLFSMPIFELKDKVPDGLTWFDFFVNTDKQSYWSDENFFKINNNVEDLKNVNSVLFPKAPLQTDCFSYYYRLRAFSLTSENAKEVVTKEQYLSTYWWNIEGKEYTLQEIVQAVYGSTPEGKLEQKEKILAALTPESLQSFSAPTLSYNERVEGSEPRLYIRDLKKEEKNPLFFNAVMGAEDAPPLQFIEVENKRFKSLDGAEVNPFIAIDPISNWGTFIDNSPQPNQVARNRVLEKDFPGSEFSRIHYYAYDDRRTPIGALSTPTLPSDQYINYLFARITAYAASYPIEKYDLRNAVKAIANLKEPGKYNYSFYNIVAGFEVPQDLTEDFVAYSNWLDNTEAGGNATPPKPWFAWATEDVINGMNLYYLGAKGNYQEYAIIRNSYVSVWDAWDADDAKDEFDFIIDPPIGRIKSIIKHINLFYYSRINNQGRTLSFDPVKGGLAAKTTQVLEKEIFDGTPSVNVYDLFSLMLKDKKDKEVFDRILKSLFVKEQTTIISIVHRMLSEAYYPEVRESFNSTISSCFEVVLSAVASANGDYQHTSKSNSRGSAYGADDFARDIGSIGLGLVKFFFGSLASAVDPTWKTPWLAPGPFTPFGIAAKLLEEVEIEEPSKKVRKPPTIPPGVCEDSLLQANDFFTKFIETYKETLSSKGQDSDS